MIYMDFLLPPCLQVPRSSPKLPDVTMVLSWGTHGRLTAAKIKSLSSSGLYGDGGTLYLNIAPRGSKSWIQRITINGKRRDIGLGGYPLVSLAEARDKAFQNRKLARSGGDPLAAKRRVNVPTFREAGGTDLRGEPRALAQRQGREDLDAAVGAPRLQTTG